MGFNDETCISGIQDLTFISHKKCNKYSNGIWEHWSRFSSHYIVHIETYLTNIQIEFGSIDFWNQFKKKKTCISKSIKLSLVFKFICQWSWFLVIEAWVGTLLQHQLTLQVTTFNVQWLIQACSDFTSIIDSQAPRWKIYYEICHSHHLNFCWLLLEACKLQHYRMHIAHQH